LLGMNAKPTPKHVKANTMSMGLSAGQRDALAVDIRKSQTIKPSTYFQHAVLPQNAPTAHLSD